MRLAGSLAPRPLKEKLTAALALGAVPFFMGQLGHGN